MATKRVTKENAPDRKEWDPDLSDVVNSLIQHVPYKERTTPPAIPNYKRLTENASRKISPNKIFKPRQVTDGAIVHPVKPRFRPEETNSIYILVEQQRTSDLPGREDDIVIRMSEALDPKTVHKYLSEHKGLKPEESDLDPKTITYYDEEEIDRDSQGNGDIIRVEKQKGSDPHRIYVPQNQTRKGEILYETTKEVLDDIQDGYTVTGRPQAASQTMGTKPTMRMLLTQEGKTETIQDLRMKIELMQNQKNKTGREEIRKRDRKNIGQAVKTGIVEKMDEAVQGASGGDVYVSKKGVVYTSNE